MTARLPALGVLALLAASALAQSTLHGKTSSQVLAMGEEKWMSHVADQEGGTSTSGMVQALDFYYEAAYRRNVRLLAKQKRSRREALKAARAAMKDLGRSLLTAEMTANGGGTMFSLFFPSRAIHIEEALYRMMGKQAGPSAAVGDEDLAQMHLAWAAAQRGTAVEEAKQETDGLLVKAQDDLAAALVSVGKLPQGDRDTLRALIKEWFRVEQD